MISILPEKECDKCGKRVSEWFVYHGESVCEKCMDKIIVDFDKKLQEKN